MNNGHIINEANFIITKSRANNKDIYWATDPLTNKSGWGYDENEAKTQLKDSLIKDLLIEEEKEKPLNNEELEVLKKWIDKNIEHLIKHLKQYKIIYDHEYPEISISVVVNHFDIIKTAFEKKNRKIILRFIRIKGVKHFGILYKYNESEADDLILKHYQ